MTEEQLNRTVRQIAWWPLLRAVVPLIAVAATMSVAYLWLGATSDVQETFYGVPLLLAGCVCALIGFRTRYRDLRSTAEPHTQGYGLIFLGWALTLVGLVLPWYLA